VYHELYLKKRRKSMSNYVVAYHAGNMPDSPEGGTKYMAKMTTRRRFPGAGTMKSFSIFMVLLAVPFSFAAPQLTEVTPDVRAEVIEGIAELLEDLYVIPETADEVQQMLRANLAAGHYDEDVAPAAFAAALTRDMYALTGDMHLRVSFGSDGGIAVCQPVKRELDNASGDAKIIVREGEEPIRRHEKNPGTGSDGGIFDGVGGIPEAKILPGNVGYVDIRLFVPRAQEEEVAVKAMETVSGADALIFDLRSCAGGTPDMVHFITSYLFPPEPMHLLTYYRAHSEPDSAYTLAEIPGTRRPDVPVYLLISPFTGSGCEEFSYNLKHHGRAELIGETTAGAGHGGGVHALAAGFSAFIPDFRPVHPKTGGGWEGVGVIPTIECSSDKAPLLAHKMALERILDDGGVEQERAEELTDLIRGLDEDLARADEPTVVDADALAEYAGAYEYRFITLEDDGLYLQRTGGPKLKMVAADEPDSFTLKRIPQARVRFERGADGAIVALHVLGMSGEWEITKRQ
jgi:hypothetical protein